MPYRNTEDTVFFTMAIADIKSIAASALIYNSRNFIMLLGRFQCHKYRSIYNSRNFIMLLGMRENILGLSIYNSRNFIMLLGKLEDLECRRLSTTVEISLCS